MQQQLLNELYALDEAESTIHDYFLNNIGNIRNCERQSIAEFLTSRNHVIAKKIRKTLLNKTTKRFPDLSNKKPKTRRGMDPICEDIFALLDALTNNCSQYAISAYNTTELANFGPSHDAAIYMGKGPW